MYCTFPIMLRGPMLELYTCLKSFLISSEVGVDDTWGYHSEEEIIDLSCLAYGLPWWLGRVESNASTDSLRTIAWVEQGSIALDEESCTFLFKECIFMLIEDLNHEVENWKEMWRKVMGGSGHTLWSWTETRIDQLVLVHLPDYLRWREYISQLKHLTRLLVGQEGRGVVNSMCQPDEVESLIST